MKKFSLTLAAAVLASTLATGCAPLLIGGAMVGGVTVATDRRTSGTQLEDETIEIKAGARIREQLGDRVHINVNSYNRVVLITGEARNEEDKATVERLVAGVENVTNVMNEVGVTMLSSLSSRSNDVVIQGKVKAQLIDARDLLSNAFYVVVERGAIVLRRPEPPVRAGWAQAAQAVADAQDDALLLGEFGNAGDADLAW